MEKRKKTMKFNIFLNKESDIFTVKFVNLVMSLNSSLIPP